jgi:carbon-monoxide dehydrogenase small subunit
MSVFELLRDNPNPTDDEIKETLGGNLCRCTGYQSIMEAVHLAARRMRRGGGQEPGI